MDSIIVGCTLLFFAAWNLSDGRLLLKNQKQILKKLDEMP